MNTKFVKSLLIIFILISGCQTIKKKSDEVVEKENERFGLFVGKPVSELRMEIGAPSSDYISENGNEILIYKTKKFGIPCERKFEISSEDLVIGFVSKGCF